ncbi:DYW family of nucleic acid deaminases-domain-containing protein [Echria macrotheca]|uniref:DYW family of nucleic acid deaminases-domain-containing protein n=1 Tax=Echria macrotheca TaxID=438768 RepID=A0AAJ0BCC6_9PEZI|nr:DYW family of nucleic acid deaminases-domain-containing protein [Echria macrotheca]
MAGQYQVAKVVWWDYSSMYVRCPICDEIHRHGFPASSDYATTHRRLPHCGQVTLREYRIQFPLKDDEPVYEIDKQRALFVAGGEDPTEYFLKREGNRLPTSVPNTSNLRRWTEATEMVHVDLPGLDGGWDFRKIDGVASAMVQGKIEYVREYLESSAEADIFLRGVQAQHIEYPKDYERSDDDSDVYVSGETALHMAACEMYPEIVELLLGNGADPNIVNGDDRTPLAEAALWGRLDNVEVLLKYGAKKELECMRDGQRLLAVDFAKPGRANADERYRRSGQARVDEFYRLSGREQKFYENTYQRDKDRKAIVRLLEDEESRDREKLAGFVFTNSFGPESLLTLIAHFEIPNRLKTVGVLYRGRDFPVMAAMSGWSHRERPDANIQIAGVDWTEKVHRLCQIVGHRLEPHDYDQGEPGRYHACHAEKQLIAFFVHKHVFLPHETEWNPSLEEPSLEEPSLEERLHGLTIEELPEEQYEKLQRARDHTEKLSRLKSAAPPTSLKKAMIMVCRPICGDCEQFVERTNLALGLEIIVSHSRVGSSW